MTNTAMSQYSGQHYHNSKQHEHQQRNFNNNNVPHSRQETRNGFYSHRSTTLSTDRKQFGQNPTINSLRNKDYDDHLFQRQTSSNQMNSRKDKREKEFVPSFVLMDACKMLDEKKVKEISRKLSLLSQNDAEAVVNFQDQAGRTPLSYACSQNGISVIEELGRLRFLNPNLADNDGNAPLHYCAQAGFSEVVDLMIARFDKLDLNCRNGFGLTPLMKAALQGRTRCAKSLLAAGASSYLRDYTRNLTAAEWARLCGRHICSEVIIRTAKDAHRHSGSSSMNFSKASNSSLPTSKSDMELRRMNSDDSPYYHLYARSTLSGANWLKNKIKKALGTSGTSPNVRSLSDKRPPISDGSYTLMGGATICAGSLLLPSIKPLIEQQRARQAVANRKITIPTLQITPVKK